MRYNVEVFDLLSTQIWLDGGSDIYFASIYHTKKSFRSNYLEDTRTLEWEMKLYAL